MGNPGTVESGTADMWQFISCTCVFQSGFEQCAVSSEQLALLTS